MGNFNYIYNFLYFILYFFLSNILKFQKVQKICKVTAHNKKSEVRSLVRYTVRMIYKTYFNDFFLLYQNKFISF